MSKFMEEPLDKNVYTDKEYRDIKARNYTEQGDINISNEVIPDSQFVAANLTYFHTEGVYLEPLFTEEALETLKSCRVCLVHGEVNFEKRSFIRFLAYKLLETHPAFDVKELKFTNEEDNILKSFRNSESKVIYILEDIQPQLIKYDISKCHEYSREKANDLFIIISTDRSIGAWNLSEDEAINYAFEVRDPIYNQQKLEEYLIKRLQLEEDKLCFAKQMPLKELMLRAWNDLNPTDLAEKLRTPDNIKLFVDTLARQKEIPSVQAILEMVDSIAENNASPVSKWYRQLPAKEKLIALGMALFHGLYEDQFFKMMELATKKFWKHAESSLLALDYTDLEFAYDYFRIEDLDTGVGTIMCRYPNQRLDIIRAAWNSNRRHILAILPVVIDTAYKSVNRKYSDWERFGTLQRQVNMRFVISNLLGEAGLVSTGAVENSLLLLAVQKKETLQKTAARALARWRESDQEDKLFTFLREWFHGNRAENLTHLVFNEDDNGEANNINPEPIFYLKSTIVYTLSYAARYDYRNQLHREFVSLLRDSFRQSDRRFRKQVGSVVPMLIEQNFLQLQNLIKEDLVKHNDMLDYLAGGMARANYYYSAELQNTLDTWAAEAKPHIKVGYPGGWWQEVKAILFKVINFVARLFKRDLKLETRRQLFYHEGRSKEENMVATLLKTYARMRKETEVTNHLDLNTQYRKVAEHNSIPRNTQLRRIYLATVASLANKNYQLATTKIAEMVDQEDLMELKNLASCFYDIFLKQRRNIKSDRYNYVFRYRNKGFYPFWPEVENKVFTKVEEQMSQWITSEDLLLNRLASLTLLEISTTFYAAEQQAIETLHAMETPVTEVFAYENLKYEQMARLNIWFQVKVWLRLLLTRPGNKKATLSVIRTVLHTPGKYGKEQY
ncbi:MAG: hypothetical protein WBA74_19420, partial [Cyclobacteriaceae bacterium]